MVSKTNDMLSIDLPDTGDALEDISEKIRKELGDRQYGHVLVSFVYKNIISKWW